MVSYVYFKKYRMVKQLFFAWLGWVVATAIICGCTWYYGDSVINGLMIESVISLVLLDVRLACRRELGI